MKKPRVKLQIKTTKVRVLQDAAIRVLDAELVKVAGGGPTAICTIQMPTCGG